MLSWEESQQASVDVQEGSEVNKKETAAVEALHQHQGLCQGLLAV